MHIHRLRRRKMEKRTFADQSNSLVDFSKVREASECITFSRSVLQTRVASNVFFLVHLPGRCTTLCMIY